MMLDHLESYCTTVCVAYTSVCAMVVCDYV